jgi:flagellar assembly protein FliH
MMNSPSEVNSIHEGAQGNYAAAASGADAMSAFVVTETIVAPFEFRSLSYQDTEELAASMEAYGMRRASGGGNGRTAGSQDRRNGRAERPAVCDHAELEDAMRSAVEAARQEGLQAGERQGRLAARMEMEAESSAALLREREKLVEAVQQFRVAKERYFADVEQEVVKLALAIAGRVLHREAQIDPLLLAGVVRVALEKMADRSGVVLRVAGPDVEAWDGIFRTTEASERPRVTEDARLERGECVLETKMGTVELGVQVQLQEIEKGFFDLLNHRPVE